MNGLVYVLAAVGAALYLRKRNEPAPVDPGFVSNFTDPPLGSPKSQADCGPHETFVTMPCFAEPCPAPMCLADDTGPIRMPEALGSYPPPAPGGYSWARPILRSILHREPTEAEFREYVNRLRHAALPATGSGIILGGKG